jgi:UDP-N-acetylglucosamine 1-carboxyvinyltransferase
MKKYIINGGGKLEGIVTISGSKNVATKAVIAACLTNEPVLLKNVPQISDIDALLEVIESIGGVIEKRGNDVTVTVTEIKNHTISLAEGARVIIGNNVTVGPSTTVMGNIEDNTTYYSEFKETVKKKKV